jgi:Protein of unknown function (DUF4239)
MTNMLASIMPAWLLFILMVGGPVGVVWIGMLLWRPRVKAPLDEAHNEVTGIIFAGVSVVYSVILAFLVVVVWEQHLAAESTVSQEAAALIAVAYDSTSFPESARGQVHDWLREYALFTMNDEWRTMDEGTLEREDSTRTLAMINDVWTLYRTLPPTAVETHTATSLDDLSAQRAARLQANRSSVPDFLWLGLVAGGMVTVFFCLIVDMKNIRIHALMTALLTSVIAMALWLIVVINHPFTGDMHVSTDAFQYALHVIDSLPR